MIMLLSVFGIILLVVLYLLLLLVMYWINSLSDKWIEKRRDEIRRELVRHGYTFYSEDYKFLFFEWSGYYFCHQESGNRTKSYSKFKFQRTIFKLYTKSLSEVLNIEFEKYDLQESKKRMKYNNKFFSNNKYKCAVSFREDD